MPSPFVDKTILQLAQQINAAGGRALLVGGCVRDRLMNLKSKDWDIEVFGIESHVLSNVLVGFGGVNIVGEAFTVYKLKSAIAIDISLPRREKKSGRGHRGFIVTGDPSMSFEEAARRRDFTINAIMSDPLTGELIDPFNGRTDIERKILRAVSPETFGEDSLRVLRAAQFAARFEFEIDDETADLCCAIDLSDLPPERIWGELEKLLLRAQRPSIGLRWFEALDVTRKLFPELAQLKGVPQDPQWHPEGDVAVHTQLVVDRARELIDDLPYAKQVTVMLGALCHDFGKASTTALTDGRWRSLGHDVAGVAPTESFLDRLRIHSLDGYDVRGQVISLVREHLKPGEFYKKQDQVGDGAFKRLARRCELELLYRIARADSLGRNADWVPREKWCDAQAQEWFIEHARELLVEEHALAPLLMGRHLMEMNLKPSPQFKEILDAVYELQLDGKIKSLEEAKDAATELIRSRSGQQQINDK